MAWGPGGGELLFPLEDTARLKAVRLDTAQVHSHHREIQHNGENSFPDFLSVCG